MTASGAAVMTRGFADPVLDSQAAFRIILDTMAHPGRIHALPTDLSPPAPLLPTAAAILLTLADFETPVWLDPRLAAAEAYVRFHTGARICADMREAAFAVVAGPVGMPPLAAFAQGTAEYPDRSATIVVQVGRIVPAGLSLRGPGIEHEIEIGFEPACDDLALRLEENRASFPLGVDLLLVDGAQVAALPRSVHVAGG